MASQLKTEHVSSKRWDYSSRSKKGMSTTNSMMFARVDSRPDISSAVGDVSHPVDVLVEGDVHERLKSGSTSMHLLT